MPRTGLEPAHLSTHAPETCASTNSATWASFCASVSCLFNKWSGKRDSDPRPQPWQGCALPTELFPHFLFISHSFQSTLKQAFLQMRCKGTTIFWDYKTFHLFFLHKVLFLYLSWHKSTAFATFNKSILFFEDLPSYSQYWYFHNIRVNSSKAS